MIVHCINFGAWWTRHEEFDCAGELIRDRSRWFNSTGIRSETTAGKVKTKWHVRGTVRVNMKGFPFVKTEKDLSGLNVHIEGLFKNQEENRVVISTTVSLTCKIDTFLVTVSNSTHGQIDFHAPWKSGDVNLVARSEQKCEQETLLLMSLESYIRTETGKWVIQKVSGKNAHKVRYGLVNLSVNATSPERATDPLH